MLKNILKSLKIWYQNRVLDTTREQDEYPEEVEKSQYHIKIDLPFSERLKFLFTNKGFYTLTRFQEWQLRQNFKL